jgi:hypothetical protein
MAAAWEADILPVVCRVRRDAYIATAVPSLWRECRHRSPLMSWRCAPRCTAADLPLCPPQYRPCNCALPRCVVVQAPVDALTMLETRKKT